MLQVGATGIDYVDDDDDDPLSNCWISAERADKLSSDTPSLM
jgi:hypothetical protein